MVWKEGRRCRFLAYFIKNQLAFIANALIIINNLFFSAKHSDNFRNFFGRAVVFVLVADFG